MKKLFLILTALSLAFSTATFAKSKKADAEQFSCSDGKRTCKDMDNCDDANAACTNLTVTTMACLVRVFASEDEEVVM